MTETPDQTISEFCPVCRAVVENVIVERDEDGWVSDTRMGDEHRKAHELRLNLEGLVVNSAAAMVIGIAGGDWRTAGESAALALWLNDPKPEEDER